jgi:hypothetical protein
MCIPLYRHPRFSPVPSLFPLQVRYSMQSLELNLGLSIVLQMSFLPFQDKTKLVMNTNETLYFVIFYFQIVNMSGKAFD